MKPKSIGFFFKVSKKWANRKNETYLDYLAQVFMKKIIIFENLQ